MVITIKAGSIKGKFFLVLNFLDAAFQILVNGKVELDFQSEEPMVNLNYVIEALSRINMRN